MNKRFFVASLVVVVEVLLAGILLIHESANSQLFVRGKQVGATSSSTSSPSPSPAVARRITHWCLIPLDGYGGGGWCLCFETPVDCYIPVEA